MKTALVKPLSLGFLFLVILITALPALAFIDPNGFEIYPPHSQPTLQTQTSDWEYFFTDQFANQNPEPTLQTLLDPNNFNYKTKQFLEMAAQNHLVDISQIVFKLPEVIFNPFRLAKYSKPLQAKLQEEQKYFLTKKYLPRDYVYYQLQSSTQNTLAAVFEKIDFNQTRQRLLASLGYELPLPLTDPKIVVHKSMHKLELYSGAQLIKTYKVGMGQITGQKQKQGDNKTPEGVYHLINRNEYSRFHLFLGLNYPNATDAQRGVQKGIISSGTAAQIAAAENHQQAPSWGTALGGAVGVHGSGNFKDWTAGCIALSDKDIEEIWLATKHWTPVVIYQ